jgi:hypothetical protein
MNAPATPAAVLPATLTMPLLVEGEIYAGLVLEAGAWHHLVLLPAAEPKPLVWAKAMAWAKEQSGDLPSRPEQSVLYANLPDEFKKDWYWSNTPYAGDESYAWCQHFNYGDQNHGLKDGKLRARAVRRVAI